MPPSVSISLRPFVSKVETGVAAVAHLSLEFKRLFGSHQASTSQPAGKRSYRAHNHVHVKKGKASV